MIVCRKCRWLGVKEDLKWGACPHCGRRKFANNVELWAEKVAWGVFSVVLVYLVSQARLPLLFAKFMVFH